MNANELADLIECACCAYQKEAGAMLRQQQAEIEALKSHPAELTDEKINLIVFEIEITHIYDDPKRFARAILRKAQE